MPSPSVALRAPGPFDVELRPPGSKSLSNRALLLAALARGRSTLRGMLDAEDTRHMRQCLEALGITVSVAGDVWTVEGTAGPLRSPPGTVPTLWVGTAGTVARLLGAVLAASPVHVVLDGSPRMRERPMAQLLDALIEQGAQLRSQQVAGFLPVEIGPAAPMARLRGGEIRLSRPASSQIVSGLMLAATLAEAPTRIVLEQGTPARPYVDMTRVVLEAFGGACGWEAPDVLWVEPIGRPARDAATGPSGGDPDASTEGTGTWRLVGRDYAVEPDASAASYPLSLAALYGGRCVIPDLGRASVQGDVGFAEVLGRMGAAVEQTDHRTVVRGTGTLRGGDFDLGDMPDMTLTLAALAVRAQGPTRIRGVAILRHHESDRLAAAATELRKVGARVVEHPDGLDIEPPPGGPTPGVTVHTYLDHRMAMGMSLLGDVVLEDPGCVAKTWPEYFSVLDKLGMVIGRVP